MSKKMEEASSRTTWPWKMGPTRSPEMSVRYQPALRNISEDDWIQGEQQEKFLKVTAGGMFGFYFAL
jgi:hypothetical protein